MNSQFASDLQGKCCAVTGGQGFLLFAGRSAGKAGVNTAIVDLNGEMAISKAKEIAEVHRKEK